MWSREEIEAYNASKVNFLESVGAAAPTLLQCAADELERREQPHVACFLQLPFPIWLESVPHSLKLAEPGIFAQVVARICSLEITDRGTARLHPESSERGHFEITQLVIFVPLWSRRRDFHQRYREAHFGDGKTNPIIVPADMSWLEGATRSMRVSDYDESLCRRMRKEMHILLRNLLPAYSVLSLCESPVPTDLSAFFVMSLPGHVLYNRLPQSILRVIGDLRTAKPREQVTASALQSALTVPLRTISKLEHQLFAMNRLRSDGEPGLALIGALSLAEWYVNIRLPKKTGNKHQPSLSTLLRDPELLSFLNPSLRETLLEAIAVRNRLVHGAPPNREDIADGGSNRAGAEIEGLSAVHATMVELAIQSVFDLYREINLHLRSIR